MTPFWENLGVELETGKIKNNFLLKIHKWVVIIFCEIVNKIRSFVML